MTYIPRHLVTKLIPNKFKAIKIVALEARRLNDRARTYNVSLPGKITTLAVDRLIDGKVDYYDTKERARQVRLEMEQEQEKALAQEQEQEKALAQEQEQEGKE